MAVLASLLVAGSVLSSTACDPAEPLTGPVAHRVGAAAESRGVVLAPGADT